MSKDTIVEEVRRSREARAKRLGYDIEMIMDEARTRQHRSGRRVVSLARKARKPSEHQANP
jgi:hypothetical protein